MKLYRALWFEAIGLTIVAGLKLKLTRWGGRSRAELPALAIL